MNHAKIYSDITGRTARHEQRLEEEKEKGLGQFVPNQSPAEDASRKQIKLNWLQSSVTSEVFSSIGHEIDELIESAIKEAASFPQHGNYMRIIHLLVRAEELRKVIKNYARD